MNDAVNQSIAEIFANFPPFMTVKETSELLRVDPQTTRNLIEKGELPGRKVGGRWVILRDLLKQQIIDGVPSGDTEE